MNGNTAESYGWPPEGGGGTVYPDFSSELWSGSSVRHMNCLEFEANEPIACRFAGGGKAAVVSSLTLDRYEGACADGVSAFEQSRAEHTASRAVVVLGSAQARAVAEHTASRAVVVLGYAQARAVAEHGTTAIQASAWQSRASNPLLRKKVSTIWSSAGHKTDKSDKTDDGAGAPVYLSHPASLPHSRRYPHSSLFSFSSHIPAPGGYFVPGTGCILSPQIP